MTALFSLLLWWVWRRLWSLGAVPAAVYQFELHQIARAVELELRRVDGARKAAA